MTNVDRHMRYIQCTNPADPRTGDISYAAGDPTTITRFAEPDEIRAVVAATLPLVADPAKRQELNDLGAYCARISTPPSREPTLLSAAVAPKVTSPRRRVFPVRTGR